MMSEHLDLTDPGTLTSLLTRHGFRTRKALGQHFLISRKALEAIIAACELQDGAPVLEIGPGVGTVTRELAERGASVTAVELDPRALDVLRDSVGGFCTVHVVPGDILSVDFASLLGHQRWTAVGNLPYYITSPVITRILEERRRFIRAIFMVQREVADRLRAAPGTKEYGSLSVFAQVFAEVERVTVVPRGAFLPPPKVDSAVVRLTMRAGPLVSDALQGAFFTVVRAAFGQRRKTLSNALAGGGVLGGNREAVVQALHAAGIDPSRRGETLSIQEYVTVAEEITRGR